MSSLAVGIDLGTTNSCVALYRDGKVEIIENQYEKRTTPSFVYYGKDGTVVGEDAEKWSAIEPQNGIYDAKRLIGSKFDDSKVQDNLKLWPFTVSRGGNGEPQIELTQKGKKLQLRPEEVSAELLRQLIADVSREVEEDVVNAVITVPAYFSNSQREATKDAAKLAGLNVLKLINEPTSAALAFAQSGRGKNCGTVLVYDLGGGTFDVSLIAFKGHDLATVEAVSGDTHLGGRDFDNNLVTHVKEEIRKMYGATVVEDSGQNYRMAMRRLRSTCEEIKKTLSRAESAVLTLDAFFGADVKLTITREQFERLNSDLFQKTIDIVDAVLKEKQVDKASVDDILLVGGSTRIPLVQRMVQTYFGKPSNKAVNPDEAVAVGAALQAAIMNDSPCQNINSYMFKDVTPLSLGIELVGKEMSIIVRRNTQIPAEIERDGYSTASHNQTAIRITVFEGESADVDDNDALGEFLIDGVTPRPAGEVKVWVKFRIDMNGILQVTAKESSQNLQKKLNIVLNNGRLTDEEIKKIIARAEANRADY